MQFHFIAILRTIAVDQTRWPIVLGFGGERENAGIVADLLFYYLQAVLWLVER